MTVRPPTTTSTGVSPALTAGRGVSLLDAYGRMRLRRASVRPTPMTRRSAPFGYGREHEC